MRLNFNCDVALKRLLSSEMYLAYTKGIQGGLFNDTEENRDSTDNIDVTNKITELLAFKILRKSIGYTPVVTGKLRNSSYIKKYETGYEIGYTADYAIYVHEVGSNIHASPTQYKYLEDAAFEVLEEYYSETGIIVPIKIQYDPLRVFIGSDTAPGEKLANVKMKEDLSRNVKYYERLLNNFINFDSSTASDSDLAYFNKMKDFFEYYRSVRHFNDWNIISEWVDRNRHK